MLAIPATKPAEPANTAKAIAKACGVSLAGLRFLHHIEHKPALAGSGSGQAANRLYRLRLADLAPKRTGPPRYMIAAEGRLVLAKARAMGWAP
jgi:hypothetical protein